MERLVVLQVARLAEWSEASLVVLEARLRVQSSVRPELQQELLPVGGLGGQLVRRVALQLVMQRVSCFVRMMTSAMSS